MSVKVHFLACWWTLKASSLQSVLLYVPQKSQSACMCFQFLLGMMVRLLSSGESYHKEHFVWGSSLWWRWSTKLTVLTTTVGAIVEQSKTHIHPCASTCTHMHTHAHVCVHTHTHKQMNKHTHAHEQTHTHTNTYTCMPAHKHRHNTLHAILNSISFPVSEVNFNFTLECKYTMDSHWCIISTHT